MNKKASIFILCFILIFSVVFSSVAVSAEGEHPEGLITVGTVKATNGDSVIIPFDISSNPGIMAITISVTYDSSALEYEKYRGGIFWEDTIQDHPDKNLVRVVFCYEKNRFGNSLLFALQFKIKEKADYGFYPITIDYKKGDFCNSKLVKLMPDIVAGGIDIEYNGTNCNHKSYNEWETVLEPTCSAEGAKQRLCKRCPHIDIGSIPKADHIFSTEWIIDKPATKKDSGVMSRHCLYCEEITDIMTYSLEQSDDEKFENTEDTVIKPSDFIDKLVGEQLSSKPDKNNSSSAPIIDKPDNEETESTDDLLKEEERKEETIIKPEETASSEDIVAKIISAIPDPERFKNTFTAAFVLLSRLLFF